MHPTPTLHDFVLNLLTNSEARSAFQLDPAGTLTAAGLGDVSPTDVRDLIPLVADVTPAHVAGLDTGLPQFATSALGADRVAPAVSLPVSLPVPGALPAVDPALATAAGLTAATGLSAATDFAGGTAGLTGTGAVAGSTGLTGAISALGGVDTLLGGAGGAGLHAMPDGASAGASADANAFSPAHDLAGSLDADADAGGVTGGVTGAVHSVPATVGDLADPLSHLAGGVLDPVTSGVTGALPDPLDAGHAVAPHVVSGVTGALPGVTGALPDAGSTLHGVLPGVTGVLSGAPTDHSGADHAAAHASTDTHLLDLTHLF